MRRISFAAAGIFLCVACTSSDRLAPTAGAPAFEQLAGASASTLPPVRFSEIHYDNSGIDAGEAIEVSGPAGTSLAGWSVVLYNGANGLSYNTRALTGTIPSICDSRGVVVLNYPVDGIQNGSPDGIALIDGAGSVVEFLSYEGSFTALNGPASGQASVDIGISEPGTTPLGSSLKRNGAGNWNGPDANNFGICNDDEPPPPPPPPPPLPDTRFTELHYDNDGTDLAEAIEIEGPAGTDLTGWSVVLYNGNGGAAYDTRVLSGVIAARCGARGVVRLTYPSNGIQNGSPDGVALVDAAGAVVEFLSYEGTFVAADGPAAGLGSRDIGVSEPGNTLRGSSLARLNTGTWQAPAPASFGACNEADPGPTPPPILTISFTGRTAGDPPLPVGFQDQLFSSVLDPFGVAVPSTITWSVETPVTGSIDQDGVLTALEAGSVTARATLADGATATVTLPTIVATDGAAAYQNHAEFGEPTDADPSDDAIVRRRQYTASFNAARGIPNWVSYNLDASHFGSLDRCDCFTFDPQTPGPSYTTAAYTGSGAFHGFGIDRGHLARSFDRTSGTLDNATTFYFSNIVPQAADLNQGPWAEMENDLGNLARFQNREVYIITGPAGSRFTLKNEGRITMPASMWKVALILPRDFGLDRVDSYDDVEVIAVIMPNEAGIRDVAWETYETTVDEVEALSGYDLLALLPDRVEHILESGVGEVEGLVDGLVAAGTLDVGNAVALKATLEAAAAQIAHGNPTAGLNQVEAFLNQVDALERSRRLAAADADTLRAAAAVVVESAS